MVKTQFTCKKCDKEYKLERFYLKHIEKCSGENIVKPKKKSNIKKVVKNSSATTGGANRAKRGRPRKKISINGATKSINTVSTNVKFGTRKGKNRNSMNININNKAMQKYVPDVDENGNPYVPNYMDDNIELVELPAIEKDGSKFKCSKCGKKFMSDLLWSSHKKMKIACNQPGQLLKQLGAPNALQADCGANAPRVKIVPPTQEDLDMVVDYVYNKFMEEMEEFYQETMEKRYQDMKTRQKEYLKKMKMSEEEIKAVRLRQRIEYMAKMKLQERELKAQREKEKEEKLKKLKESHD